MRLSALLPALALLGVALAGAPGPKKPVYIGARACASCHTGASIGNQYSIWLHSKHSQAYAALARPESAQIAAISGLRQDAQKAPVCLGCHTTASHVEDWERDDTFRIEDGVQCETCHGPGSEYANEATMRDRDAAIKAGLILRKDRECINCHVEKGSHTAVLQKPPVDVTKAWAEIAHPVSRPSTSGSVSAPGMAGKAAGGAEYIGSAACGKCHDGESMGHQYSKWRMGPHARAWSTLGSAAALKVAGAGKEPQQNAACLRCHAVNFRNVLDDGVGCEACHGPGSHYASEAVMRDRRAAQAAGLRPVGAQTCAPCHSDAHGKKFDIAAGMKTIAHPLKLPQAQRAEPYKTPLNMALRPDGRELYVACEGSDSVIVVDTASRKKTAEIKVGGNPAEVTFTPDGTRAFVSNRHDDTVSEIDVSSRKVTRTIPVGDEPHGVLTDAKGRLLYVLNTASDDISVFELPSLRHLKNLSAGRGPWSLALSPDGETIAVTNSQARFAFRKPFASEVTAIETERAVVDNRYTVPGANLILGVDWHPSGKFALATLNRTKTLVPMTRLMQGWTITNGLGILWRDGGVDEVLLDEPSLGFADATDIAITPDGKYALVTSSGTDRLAVVDIAKMTGIIQKASPEERERVLPNHLGYPTEFIVRHLATGRSPRGVLVTADGKTAYVANSLDDDISVIDLVKLQPAGRIDLDGPKSITKQRYGERLFHSANITFRKQYSCHSCHPDGHVDGLTYDIEADGIGVMPVDNRTLRGILDTAPFKWEGTNPSLSRQCGARLSVFFTRLAPFTPDELAAVDYYITNIPRPPNRYRRQGAPFTPAQRRGKVIFERTTTADGREIPVDNRCVTCHFPPYYTDRRVRDVGTRHEWDRTGKIDVPHLNNIYDSAPYLHNGIAPTLEEIWTVYNPDDRHGVTNDLTKDQLNDLIEYIKTL